MATTFFARLLGLWVLLTMLAMAANKAATLQALNAFFADPALMWVTGVFTTLVGLTIVVAHNRLAGGAVPVIVTIYGWAALLKGLLFVWLPVPAQMQFYQSLHFEQWYYAYLTVALVVGAYLTYNGFKRDLASP
jgi:hypothetical protein